MIIFENFPMPPSDNHLYPSFVRQGRLIRAPSKEYALFRKNVEIWAYENLKQIKWARNTIQNHPGTSSNPLGIEFTFYFPRNKLFTLTGSVKKMDVSNRIKAAQDSISKLLNIDDSLFFSCIAHKKESDREHAKIFIFGGEINIAFEPT